MRRPNPTVSSVHCNINIDVLLNRLEILNGAGQSREHRQGPEGKAVTSTQGLNPIFGLARPGGGLGGSMISITR